MAISKEQMLGLIKKYPVVVLCIVVSLAVVVGAYMRSDLTSKATQELDELAKKGQRMASNIKNASGLDEQLEAMSEANHEIDARLVRFDQLAENLQYFYELEATTGTKLVDLRQMGSSGDGEKGTRIFDSVKFSVAIMGTYPQLVEFLQRLEGGPHFCRILSASFTPVAREGGAGSSLGRPESLTLTLTLELLGQP